MSPSVFLQKCISTLERDKFHDVSAKGEMAGVDEPQMILMGGLRLSQPTVNHRLGERTSHHISATPTNVKTNRPTVCFDPREAAKDREGGFRALDLKESFSPTQPPYCSILNFAFPGKIYAMTTQKDKESKSNFGQHFQLMHYLICSSFN